MKKVYNFGARTKFWPKPSSLSLLLKSVQGSKALMRLHICEMNQNLMSKLKKFVFFVHRNKIGNQNNRYEFSVKNSDV